MGLRFSPSPATWTLGRHLTQVSDSLRSHTAKLSSGLRIESASDDAAGLGLANRMQASTRSLKAIGRGIEDALGLVRAAEIGLDSLIEHVGRMRELAVQAGGPLAPEDLSLLNAEYQDLAADIDRIVQSAEHDGEGVLNQTRLLEVQTGLQAGQTLSVNIWDYSALGSLLSIFQLSPDQAGPLSELLNVFVEPQLAHQRGRLGAVQNALTSAARSTRVYRDSLTAAEGQIRDADVAHETARLIRDTVKRAGTANLLPHTAIQPELALELLRETLDQHGEAPLSLEAR